MSKISEFGLIEQMKNWIRRDSSVVKGIDDDCAVVRYTKGEYMLLTCDMIMEGVDFSKNTDLCLIGRKAIACSISDIAACGGRPRYALVSLGLPKGSSKRYVKELYRGINYWANRCNIIVVGGDLSRARKLTIDVGMIGFVKKKKLVLRSGAKKGDLIFVTGKLGGSIRGRHLSFRPRLKEAMYLVNNFKVNSMIDISDGLLQDLSHITRMSKVGAVIYEDLIPVSPDANNLEEALSMGEDFELLFTLSRLEAGKLNRDGKKMFTEIGEIMDQKYGLKLITKNCKEKLLKPKGYSHF